MIHHCLRKNTDILLSEGWVLGGDVTLVQGLVLLIFLSFGAALGWYLGRNGCAAGRSSATIMSGARITVASWPGASSCACSARSSMASAASWSVLPSSW